MFQLQPASGRKTLHRLWGRGAGPGHSQNSLSNKGLIQGRGAELGCSETRYGSRSGSACPEGADGAVGGGGGGLPGREGQVVAVGTLLCAGRLWRALLAAHCGCDVCVEGQSRRTARQHCHLPRQHLGRGTAGLGAPGSFFDPYTKPFSFSSLQQGEVPARGKGRPEAPSPIFSSRSLPPSTAACTCPKYHPSHQQRGQLRKQPSFHRGTGECCSDMPSRAPGHGRAELGCSCCGRQREHSPVPPNCSRSDPCLLPGAVLSGITRHWPSLQDQGCLPQALLREEAGAPVPALLPGWKERQQLLSKEGSTGWARLKPKPRLLSPCPASFPARTASGFEGTAGGSLPPPPVPLCPSPAAPSTAVRLFHL